MALDTISSENGKHKEVCDKCYSEILSHMGPIRKLNKESFQVEEKFVEVEESSYFGSGRSRRWKRPYVLYLVHRWNHLCCLPSLFLRPSFVFPIRD